MGFSNAVSAHDRDSPPISPSSDYAEIAAAHVLDRQNPGQVIKVSPEDRSNVKSYRIDLRHLTRVEVDIEFSLVSSGYGQDATTGWAVLKSQQGIDLAIVTQPEDFPKHEKRQIAYRRAQASGALSALSFRFEKSR
jgi:hypothetical protein